MPSGGDGWEGGDAAPPTIGNAETIWWLWSSSGLEGSCGECVSRNGTVSPTRRGSPHLFCLCSETMILRVCTFQGRTLSSEERISDMWVEIGIVPRNSHRNLHQTGTIGGTVLGNVEEGGVSIGGSTTSSTTSGDSTTIQNDGDTTLHIFEVWTTWKRVFLDTFECSAILSGTTVETYPVTQTEMLFQGYEVAEGQ